MFKTLQKTWPRDVDLPDRSYRYQMLTRVINGTVYDKLAHPFHEEEAENHEYIPLRARRPSVRYRLCRLVVDDCVSLLFSEGHFPDIHSADESTREALAWLCKELSLNQVMIDAATRGSAGSIAIWLRVLKHRAFLSVLETAFLTPVWQADAPDTLEAVLERYKVFGSDLKAAGYSIEDKQLTEEFWFARDWTDNEEIWYTPVTVADAKEGKAFTRDAKRSVAHKLGFVPIVWIKNLPGGDTIDGAPTFPDEAIDTSIEIDYQLSQAGRGLKYSGDPTLLLKEPAVGADNKIIKGGGNALVVGQDGDAKLLEINGSAVTAVIDYVRLLRELTIESMHGNRSNSEKQAAAPSGKALELMNQALIWLADKLRISYGERGLLELINMIVKAHAKVPLMLKSGVKLPEFSTIEPITLRWPNWYSPTMQDMLDRATTLVKLCDAGLMSIETAIKVMAAEYDIEDPKAEKLLADADMKARNEAAQKQVKISE